MKLTSLDPGCIYIILITLGIDDCIVMDQVVKAADRLKKSAEEDALVIVDSAL